MNNFDLYENPEFKDLKSKMKDFNIEIDKNMKCIQTQHNGLQYLNYTFTFYLTPVKAKLVISVLKAYSVIWNENEIEKLCYIVTFNENANTTRIRVRISFKYKNEIWTVAKKQYSSELEDYLTSYITFPIPSKEK